MEALPTFAARFRRPLPAFVLAALALAACNRPGPTGAGVDDAAIQTPSPSQPAKAEPSPGDEVLATVNGQPGVF